MSTNIFQLFDADCMWNYLQRVTGYMFVYVVIRSKKLAEWSRALHRVKGKDIVNE